MLDSQKENVMCVVLTDPSALASSLKVQKKSKSESKLDDSCDLSILRSQTSVHSLSPLSSNIPTGMSSVILHEAPATIPNDASGVSLSFPSTSSVLATHSISSIILNDSPVLDSSSSSSYCPYFTPSNIKIMIHRIITRSEIRIMICHLGPPTTDVHLLWALGAEQFVSHGNGKQGSDNHGEDEPKPFETKWKQKSEFKMENLRVPSILEIKNRKIVWTSNTTNNNSNDTNPDKTFGCVIRIDRATAKAWARRVPSKKDTIKLNLFCHFQINHDPNIITKLINANLF